MSVKRGRSQCAKNTRYAWRVKQFYPDPSGWNAVYHNPEDPGHPLFFRVAGWMLLQQVPYEEEGLNLSSDGYFSEYPHDRRIVAAVESGYNDGGLGMACDDFGMGGTNYWKLLPPNEPPSTLTEDECRKAYAEYSERREKDSVQDEERFNRLLGKYIKQRKDFLITLRDRLTKAPEA